MSLYGYFHNRSRQKKSLDQIEGEYDNLFNKSWDYQLIFFGLIIMIIQIVKFVI